MDKGIKKFNDLDIPEEFRNAFKSFSSSICEMEADIAVEWTQEHITSQIQANIEKIARFGGGTQTARLRDMASVENAFTNVQSGVYVVEDDLIIEGMNGEFSIKKDPGIEIPAAQTYIVKGTLKINANIVYDDSTVDPTNPGSFPSAAFIAENIEIANNVEVISGVFMAVDIDGDGNGGELKSAEDVITYDTALKINGSLVGDIYNLFFNRRSVGDPNRNEGSITVLYDERILLNTPPGLSELIEVSSLRVAN